MISGNSIEAMVYKKRDAVLNVLEPRRYRSGAPYDGMQEILAGYVADGYTLFAGPSSGDIDLSGETAGKYLVYWTSAPTGTVNVVANTITATSGTHESVVIFGGLLGALHSSKKISSFMSATFNFTGSYDFNSIIEFVGVDISIPTLSASLTIQEIDFTLCNVNFPAGAGYQFKTQDCSFSTCNIKHDSTNPSEINYTIDSEFSNNMIYRTALTGASTLKIQKTGTNSIILKNCLFYDVTGNFYCTVTAGDDGYLQNCGFINSYMLIYAGISFLSKIFTQNCELYSISGNYIETPLRDTQKFIFGVPAIDFDDTVDFADFVNVTCDISRTDEADSRLFGFGNENFYELQFGGDAMVPDALKKGVGDGYYWFIRRRDFEETLLGATIYNLSLYTAGGHTTELDFSSDENFLILAEDSSGNKAVLVWYSNQLYPTVYSDTWDGTDYEILNCFQIWEPESRSNLRNVFRNYPEDKHTGITDSPMTGKIRFNNLDREILIR